MKGFTHASVWQQILALLADDVSQAKYSFCVAFSGGLDSTVLLHVLSKIQSSIAPSLFSLKAIHINHQLHPDARRWAKSCEVFCHDLNIPFQQFSVIVKSSNKKGLEAAARSARYQAIFQAMNGKDILFTAHHQDDQVETVFLQLMRGTGIDGASAIRSHIRFGKIRVLRPLLNFTRRQLVQYALANDLKWIEDPSNKQTTFSRNYLRHDVLPLFEKRWPSYRKSIERFADHARLASDILNEYVAEDFERCFGAQKNTLSVDALKRLGREKRLLVIRYWIKQCNISMPSKTVLAQINAALDAAVDANPVVSWHSVEVRRYRNDLYVLSNETQKEFADFYWDGKNNCLIPGLGKLNIHAMQGCGIHKKFFREPVKVMFRQGGEKCNPIGRKGTHQLKKLFQEYAVPPWRRRQVPLIVIDNQIAAAVGLFYCSPFVVNKNETGLAIDLLSASIEERICIL